ncbi:uncharacterized protein LOC129593465 [Paramacrobiotus metropolitanus]|uniref:uncharacterized protein LOC129593465 n=1 Tax=Paramacrobiotus metropolitanus TaxID=2943436 RepID=UPI0024457320|nr:uncharacterized protein LOC129593465 [Paramacrobiotus metropolitanus]
MEEYGPDSGGRQKNTVIVKPILIGCKSKKLPAPIPNPYAGQPSSSGTSPAGTNEKDHTHNWTLYVRPYHNEDISEWIKKVQFKLHETYPNSVRTCTSTPYEVEETGWGEFEVQIKFFFMDPNERQVTVWTVVRLFKKETDHHLVELPDGTLMSEVYDELVFMDPSVMMIDYLSRTKIWGSDYKPEINYDVKKQETLKSIRKARERITPEIQALSAQYKTYKNSYASIVALLRGEPLPNFRGLSAQQVESEHDGSVAASSQESHDAFNTSHKMGRRSKGVSADPPGNRTLPTTTFQILPRLDNLGGLQTGGLSMVAPNLGQLMLGKVPLNLNLNDITAQLRQPAAPSQKILLPKLPQGIRPPSKIILLNGKDSGGKMKVQILNTSRTRDGLTEEERKKKMLTGEINVPSSILPKPNPVLLRRPKTLVMADKDGNLSVTQQGFGSVPKVAIPRCNPSPSKSPVYRQRRIVSRQIDHDTDAVDGFDSEDEVVVANQSMDETECFLPPNDIDISEPQMSEMPSTSRVSYRVSPQSIVISPNRLYPRAEFSSTLLGGVGQVLIQNLFPVAPSRPPNPDDFRPPKRRKLLKKPEKFDAIEKDLNLDELRKYKKKGRPSFLKKSAQKLIEEIKNDCLAVASDGINLKCLACNCLLTKGGWGYPRQILKHLQCIKSHQSRYEIWKHQKEMDPGMVDNVIPEVIRTRGRYRKTPLDYMAEFKNPWLNTSSDGQTLRCEACNLVLLDINTREGKIQRTDVYRHLYLDQTHANNIKSVETEGQKDTSTIEMETEALPDAESTALYTVLSSGLSGE